MSLYYCIHIYRSLSSSFTTFYSTLSCTILPSFSFLSSLPFLSYLPYPFLYFIIPPYPFYPFLFFVSYFSLYWNSCTHKYWWKEPVSLEQWKFENFAFISDTKWSVRTKLSAKFKETSRKSYAEKEQIL